MSIHDKFPVGVIGVGSMGRNHARVYSEMRGVDLVGVVDTDRQRADIIADEYGTQSLTITQLIERAQAISITVPTEYHYDIAQECIQAGVNVLVEKPFVNNVRHGLELRDLSNKNNIVLQIGHIERFNPAVDVMLDLATNLDIIAVDFRRLGPPLERNIDDSVISDLMIHDIDIILELIDADIDSISASSTEDLQYATARIDFTNGIIGTLTASRRTQRKVRTIDITTQSCQVSVDYIDQSIQIHRRSRPEYTEFGEGMRFRQESIVERPMLDTGEPLKLELESFIEACINGGPPEVTAEDGLRAIRIAQQIFEIATQTKKSVKVAIE